MSVIVLEVLTSLAPQLTGELKEQALEAALAAAQAIRMSDDRAEVLTSLAPQLTGELKEQCCKPRWRQRRPSRMRAVVPRC